jgi:predicted metalloprotease with PDZ domain
MRRIFLLIFLFLSFTSISQEKTIVFDGYTGLKTEYKNDTLQVLWPARNSPVDKMGIKSEDEIIQINDISDGVALQRKPWFAALTTGLFPSPALQASLRPGMKKAHQALSAGFLRSERET